VSKNSLTQLLGIPARVVLISFAPIRDGHESLDLFDYASLLCDGRQSNDSATNIF
jgi:hypothetical protein